MKNIMKIYSPAIILAGMLIIALVAYESVLSEAGKSNAAENTTTASGAIDTEGNNMKDNNYWREKLTPEQYRITREKGTERPFSGKYLHNKEEGVYRCVACGAELFRSDKKFDSGTGWPSFTDEINNGNVVKKKDTSHGMVRTEILCAKCGAHLGHLFEDGPAPEKKRYCVNSASLNFKPCDLATNNAKKHTEKATFAAGCFWGVEAAFRKVPGVIDTAVGYTGGTTENPTYRQVCTGKTGHAESVEIVFDPQRVSYAQFLEVFWKIHDPTTLNRQGPDIGTQYRSAIFYHTQEQYKIALESKAKLEQSTTHDKQIVTEITAAKTFYRAEEYHQRYLEKKGQANCHIY